MSRTELNLTTGDDKTRVNPAALMAPDQFLSCKFLARWRESIAAKRPAEKQEGGSLSKRRCNSPSLSLSLPVAGALVPAATREEAQEARLRRRVLRVRRLSTLLQRIRTTSAAGRCVPSPEEPGYTASKPVHGPALQGAMVPGKYISLYGPTRARYVMRIERAARIHVFRHFRLFPPSLRSGQLKEIYIALVRIHGKRLHTPCCKPLARRGWVARYRVYRRSWF